MLLFLERLKDVIGRKLRGMYLRATLGRAGQGCVFGSGLRIYGKPEILLGKNVIVNDGVVLQSCDGASITVGDNVVLSYDCMLLTGGLDWQKTGNSKGHLAQPVIIEEEAWLGARCIVLPGVTVGRRCVVAAGSVVSKDLPDHSFAAGVPARVLKDLSARDS